VELDPDRLGKCLLGASIITCLLVTKNSSSKKKPLAPVSGRLPSKVETRAVVSSSGSIMGVFTHNTDGICFLTLRGSRELCFDHSKSVTSVYVTNRGYPP